MGLTQKEITAMDGAGVAKRLAECQVELRGLRVKAAAQDLKNVRAIREVRQEIARLQTRRHALALTEVKK